MMDDVLFPVPRKVETSRKRLSLKDANWIVLPAGCSRHLRERIQDGATALTHRLREPIQLVPVRPRQGAPLLELLLVKRGMQAQGYQLTLNEKVRRIEACDEAGLFYGYLAFLQWLDEYGCCPPALRVEDYPDFATRGVMLDVSRCKVPTMATCKQLIDQLAGLRINQIQLYIEHTFAFFTHQAVWRDASPFAAAEIMELDQYCKDRFVELVPNLNSFGHVERWLRHPSYRHLAECPDMETCSTLAPNQASLRFLEELYDEYLPNFSSSMFNVGCDETWELAKGRSKRRAARIGTTAVYVDFLKRIHKLVTRKGKQMQFWGDIILRQPEYIDQLPRDLLALNWGYEADHPFEKQCPAFADAGVEFYVCPGTSAWRSITGRTENCLENLASAARNGIEHGARGYLITDWGDCGHHQVLPVSFAGFAAGAAYSWHLKRNVHVDLARAVSRYFFQETSGIAGRFLLEFGRTPDCIAGIRQSNRSAIHQLLFCVSTPEDLGKVTPAQFRRAAAWLDRVEAYLTGLQVNVADCEILLREMRHALVCARYALQRGQFIKSGAGERKALRSQWRSLVMSHREQWIARNRLGGLQESEDILRATLPF
jgi:hexosaminidase